MLDVLPYLLCIAAGIIIGWLITIRLDDGYHCRHCANHTKKTFAIHPDVLTAQERENASFIRYLVQTGRISDHLQ